MNDFAHMFAWFSVDGDIPFSISVKYLTQSRSTKDLPQLPRAPLSVIFSSPRTLHPLFFVSPATTNKGSVSSSFTSSSATTFSIKMMRTLEPSMYHPLSIFHLLTLPSPSLFSCASSSAFPLLSPRHFSVALSPPSIFLDDTLRCNIRGFCPLPLSLSRNSPTCYKTTQNTPYSLNTVIGI